MKKLMFAAAAAFCGTVFAVTGVESDNIVGYQNVESEVAGTYNRGAMFNTVGTTTDSIDIQSVIPVEPAGSEYSLGDGDAQIQLLDAGGEVDPTTVYLWLLEGSELSPDGHQGWHTIDPDSGLYVRANKTFSRGEGFIYCEPYFYYTEGEEEIEIPGNITVAGEVNTSAKAVQCDVAGTYIRANYRPLPLDIQKLSPIAPVESEYELGDGDAQIQLLDAGGEVDPTTVYLWLLEGSEMSPDGHQGWHTIDPDSGLYVRANKTFGPGEGFIYCEPYFYYTVDEEEIEVPCWLQFGE